MIKALLVIASMGINTEMSSMESCLEARNAILEQDRKVKVLCIPTNPKPSESEKMNDMLSIFLKMIDRIKEYEELDRLEREEDCLSRCGEGFFDKPMG
jgi:hypothetical protein